jgi:hypothetical protein
MESDILAVASRYHKLDPGDVDEILAPEFQGEYWGADHTWNRENHRQYLASGEKHDQIHEQFGSGDKVCTRFTRSSEIDGATVRCDLLHVKQFVAGKIVHVWEMMNWKQFEEQLREE